MNKFKVGDLVERIKDLSGLMPKGTRSKVTDVSKNSTCIEIEGYDGFFSTDTFKLVKTPTPRPHAELIKQWADDNSLEVQWRNQKHPKDWVNCVMPGWRVNTEYRIKPTEPSEKDLILQEIQEAKDKLNQAEKRLQGL